MSDHAPQLSIWPILVALALTLISAGILSTWIVTVLGLALLLFSLWSWVQENRETGEHAHQPVEVEVEEHRHE